MLLGPLMVLSLAFAIALPGWAYMPDEPILRGVFNHKNVLGWNAALAAICSATLALDRASGLVLPALLVLAASVACLLLSASATGLVTAGTAIPIALFFAALARQRGAGRVVLILAGLQIAALVLVAGDAALGVLLDGTDKDVSLTGRVPLWELVDQSIGRRPLLGYGYQAFWTEGNGEAWAIWARVNWMAPHAHSGYRDTLLSFGAVGALLCAAVILQAIRAGAILHRRHPEELWSWLNVWICVFLVMNLTESTFLSQNSMLFITFAAAVLMVTLRARDEAKAPPR
ncbi:O-antigen ligase family protein [Wenxinia saemankumensis]